MISAERYEAEKIRHTNTTLFMYELAPHVQESFFDRTVRPMRGITNIHEEQVISGRPEVNRKYSVLVIAPGEPVTTALPSICEQCSQVRLHRVTPTGNEVPLNMEIWPY